MPDTAADSTRTSSRALIVTLYGLYARESDGWMSVSAVVSLMSQLGVDEMAARSSISRLKRRGLLQAELHDAVAGYRLSDDALAVFAEGDRRIFSRPTASVEEGWVLVVFSVPESEREQRHQLRSRLSWLGFGTVSSGVWVAPGHLLSDARNVLARHGLDRYVDLFEAEHSAFAATADRVASWWDLSELQTFYDNFLGRYEPMLRRYRRRRNLAGASAFADYVSALTSWRRLPYLDPGLAPQYLPPGWSGERAADLFFNLRERIAAPAHDFATSIASPAR
ncbi:MAG: PaaX family transcriptional regulator [Actinomycetota bacterium]|nr:PaaX family transcriptional regulator [Actinomycetota bacterium]